MAVPVPIEGQTRRMEKRGLLILNEAERNAHLLDIYLNVLQLPLEHSVNYLYPRPKSLYCRYNLLSQGYVVDTGIVYYQNTKLFSINRQIENSTEGLGCYIDTIFQYFETIAPFLNSSFTWSYTREPIITYPFSFDSIAFLLPEGCIAEVSTIGYALQQCAELATQFTEPPEAPPLPPSAGNPPPGNSPPNSGPPGSGSPFIISPPYDGLEDGGDTYVPPAPPPSYPDDSEYGDAAFRVNGIFTARNPNGTVYGGLGSNFNGYAIIYGKFISATNSTDSSGARVQVAYRRSATATIETTSFGFSAGDSSVYFDITITGIVRI